MDVVVKGRNNVEVPDHFRQHVTEKLVRRVERYDSKVIRLDVEISHERNPRQSDHCQRVEITCKTKGPAVRAESSRENFYAALEEACDKLEGRLRRAADRRRVHHGRHNPDGLAGAPVDPQLVERTVAATSAAPLAAVLAESTAAVGGAAPEVEPTDSDEPVALLNGGLVVREKTHAAEPMSMDQALFEMELVGHDFYLFHDAECDRPSVVYRRHGYDYGVIRLGA